MNAYCIFDPLLYVLRKVFLTLFLIKQILWVPQALNYQRIFSNLSLILMTLPWPLWFCFSAYLNTLLRGHQDRQQQCNGNYSCFNYRQHKTFLFQLGNSLPSKTDISPLSLWLILTDATWKFSYHAQKHFQRQHFPGQKILLSFLFLDANVRTLGYLVIPTITCAQNSQHGLWFAFCHLLSKKPSAYPLETGLSSVDKKCLFQIILLCY